MRIGLFGGSFNPIHNAHIALASTICEQANLDEVWFMVSPHNPLKQAEGLLGENERYEMVKLALEALPYSGGDKVCLKASNYEFHLERPSFTWKTLEALSRDFPQHEFCLVIGGDNWVAFPRWAHHEEILAKHQIYVYPREESDFDETTLPENVHLIHTPKINITSTMLREMIGKGEDISAYVPQQVARIISEKGHYRK